MEKTNFFNTKIGKIIAHIFFVIIIFFLAFSAGVFVGGRKARFSYAWGDAYHRNFGAGNRDNMPGPMREINGRFPEMNDREFANPNGIFGKIVKINISTSSSELIISSPNGLEQTIVVDANTKIKLFRDDIKVDQLKNDNLVAVIGDNDNGGKINAKLIRVMPAPQDFNQDSK